MKTALTPAQIKDIFLSTSQLLEAGFAPDDIIDLKKEAGISSVTAEGMPAYDLYEAAVIMGNNDLADRFEGFMEELLESAPAPEA